MKSYGANSRAGILSTQDAHLEEFQLLGYTLIEGVLVEEELKELKLELDRVYSNQELELGKEFLRSIDEEYLARALAAYSDKFAQLACKSSMMAYVKKILGDYFILHLQNGIINMPNEEHHQSSWHRDLPYQNWVSSEPLGCNIFYCLDDFTEDNGGTIILPYSHKIPYLPSEAYIEKHQVQIIAPAGSVLLFDSMLFHKAGYNNSNSIRRGVNSLYGRAILRQQIDLPSMMEDPGELNSFNRMLFGFDNRSPESVVSFRNKRMKKKNIQ